MSSPTRAPNGSLPQPRKLSGSALKARRLRHTCVALLVAQDAHPLAIKDRFGHSSITVTIDQYGHLMPAIDEALTDGFEAACETPVPGRRFGSGTSTTVGAGF
jgi:hypothetical protein